MADTGKHKNNTLKLYLGKLFSGIVAKSLVVGAIAGVVTVAFRVCVTQVFSAAQKLAELAQTQALMAVVWIGAILLAAFLVARLLKWEPMIAGSGIPQLEGELKGVFSHNPVKVLLGKFTGGLLSLGAGLSLGREGPCIQMGAAVGKGFSRRGDDEQKNLLMTGGGAAGLAAAFGAPLAGILFALEEVHKSFSAKILFTSIAACATAGVVTRLLLGPAPIFSISLSQDVPLADYWILVLLGVILGAVGALYNFSVQKMQDAYGKMKRIPAPYRVVVPFVAAGILAFVLPSILGGGVPMVERMTSGSFTIAVALLLLAAKFIFSIFSFSSGVPGGILMPMIVIGALIGNAFGLMGTELFGLPAALTQNFIIFAMAGLFGAIVRAPLTGIVLVCEMTAAYDQFLPLIITTLSAYLMARLLRAKPVYDQLLDRDLSVLSHKKTA